MRSLICLAVLALLVACGAEQKFPTPSESEIDYIGPVSGIRIAVDGDVFADGITKEQQLVEYVDLLYQQTADCMRRNGWARGSEPGPLVHVVSRSYQMYENGTELSGWTDTSGLITVKATLASVFMHEFVHYMLLVNTGSVGSHSHPGFTVCVQS